MCQRQPGPRCLGHVEKQLDRAAERLVDALDELAVLQDRPDSGGRRAEELARRAFALRGTVARLEDEAAPLRRAADQRAAARSAKEADRAETDAADAAARAAAAGPSCPGCGAPGPDRLCRGCVEQVRSYGA